MQTRSYDIIISGAGPTGLMMANQLTRFGISYLILDQKPGPTNESRALVVQARSMEIYQQLGLSDEIERDGQKNFGLDLYRKGELAASVTLVNHDEQSSPFPYMMMYEQSKNETLLYNNLLAQNRQVEWNSAITAITREHNMYTLQVKQGENELTCQCTYLIACDGSKSIVRDFSGVAFTGGTYLNIFFVVDTLVEGGFASDKLSLFVGQHGISMLFPMTGEKHFRVLGVLPTEYYHKEDLPFEQILDTVKEGMQMPVAFHDTSWHSTYKLHHKKVSRFSKDNIFFAGDAAHVHSPAGGQGMNTGLQDVYNLAWKLALVLKGKAAPALLQTYHEERNPVAENLLKTTDKMFAYMSKDSAWYAWYRLYFIPFFVPLVTKFKKVRRLLFQFVSQLKVDYASSSLAKGKAGSIPAGKRMPYCKVTMNNKRSSIYTLINEKSGTLFTVLLYNVSATGFDQLDAGLFRLLQIEVNDINTKTFTAAGFPVSFVLVIRPDNYIGYISGKADVKEIKDFFQKAYFLT